jgi:hypothetical protein
MPSSRRATKLAVILPSRGICYSETIEEVYRELGLADVDYKIFWSHGRKVPDCLNVPTNRALRGSYTHFWYVDDDMWLPKGILKGMLEEDKHAIASDYPSSITMGAAVYDKDGAPYFTGSGCLLVKRGILESLKKPIWRTDVGWRMKYMNDYIEFTATKEDGDKVHGRQDVMFGIRLYIQGRPIHIYNVSCGQRRAKDTTIRQGNASSPKIDIWKKFHPNILYIPNNQSKRNSKSMEGIVLLRLNDGTETYADTSLANKLNSLGLVDRWGHATFKNWDIVKEEIV